MNQLCGEVNLSVEMHTVIENIFNEHKNIAVVGLSNKMHRPSHQVAEFMLAQGYHVIPVNPGQDSILGLKSYAGLPDIPEKVDLVNVFRKSEAVLPIVKDAIKIGAKSIWMQLGVENEEAAELARNAGLNVIMDRCWKIEYMQRSEK